VGVVVIPAGQPVKISVRTDNTMNKTRVYFVGDRVPCDTPGRNGTSQIPTQLDLTGFSRGKPLLSFIVRRTVWCYECVPQRWKSIYVKPADGLVNSHSSTSFHSRWERIFDGLHRNEGLNTSRSNSHSQVNINRIE